MQLHVEKEDSVTSDGERAEANADPDDSQNARLVLKKAICRLTDITH